MKFSFFHPFPVVFSTFVYQTVSIQYTHMLNSHFTWMLFRVCHTFRFELLLKTYHTHNHEFFFIKHLPKDWLKIQTLLLVLCLYIQVYYAQGTILTISLDGFMLSCGSSRSVGEHVMLHNKMKIQLSGDAPKTRDNKNKKFCDHASKAKHKILPGGKRSTREIETFQTCFMRERIIWACSV